MARPALKPDGSQGTGKVKLTFQIDNEFKEEKTRTIIGCFVKNDENLQRFILNHINPSADMVQFKRHKYLFYFFYTVDCNNSELNPVSATIIFYRYSKSNEKICEPLKKPQIFKYNEHAFLLCDSKYFNMKCKFLEKHSKRVLVHQSLDVTKNVFGLQASQDQDMKPKIKFIPFKINKCESNIYSCIDESCYAKLGGTSPILLPCGKENVVAGGYRKTDNGRISISLFGQDQDEKSKDFFDGSGKGRVEEEKGNNSEESKIDEAASLHSEKHSVEKGNNSPEQERKKEKGNEVETSKENKNASHSEDPDSEGTDNMLSKHERKKERENEAGTSKVKDGTLQSEEHSGKTDSKSAKQIHKNPSVTCQLSDLEGLSSPQGGIEEQTKAKFKYSSAKKVVQDSSSTNERHPSTTISTSKTNPLCNGNLSSNSSEIGSALETTDHSDGSQRTRQMADDGEQRLNDLIEEGEQRLNGEPDLTHTEEEETVKFFPSHFEILRLREEPIWREEPTRRKLKGQNGPSLQEQKRRNLIEEEMQRQIDLNMEALRELLGVPGVKNGLCERLDPEYKVLPNWKDLADRVKAPTSVKEECSSYTKYSPTEQLFEVPKVSSLKVNSLLKVLQRIGREDVREKISEAIPENERNMKVSETLLTDDHLELLDEVAVMLDTPRKGFRNNWEVLGLKLGVARDDLDQIKRGNNPANQLLQYAYRKLEAKKLKAGYFYDLFLEREDIKNFLDGLGITQEDNRSIKTIFKPNSRNMHELCALLNTNLGGTANNWRYLAYKWGMEADIYNKFDKTYQEKPSPTGKLLDWLIKEHPSFSVSELCEHLEEIGRSDVKDFLLEKAHEYFDVRR